MCESLKIQSAEFSAQYIDENCLHSAYMERKAAM